MAIKGRIRLLLLKFSCCFFLSSHCLSDTDTIQQGQQLRDWEYLNSANNVFRLKFFSPGTTGSRYVGIFYDASTEGKAVWVANRDTPIPDASGSFLINADGILQISYSGGTAIVSNSAIARTNNISATLLDSGNFVLRELNSDGSINRVLWQSFDYPTDTLLPGMKLGINFKTGDKWSLTSWVSDAVPASGSFTLGGDPDGTSQLIIWWQGNISWTSGLWRNGQFPNVQFPNDRYMRQYSNFKLAWNGDDKYFTYLVNETDYSPSYTLRPDGSVEGAWAGPFGACLIGGSVNPGCVSYELPKCRNNNYLFDKRQTSHIDPLDGFKFDDSSNASIFDCQAKCLNNCSCVAYASTSDNGTGCEIWTRLKGFNSDRSIEVYFLHSKKGTRWWIWLLIAVGILVTLLLCCSCYLVRRKFKVKGEAKISQKTLLYELGGDTVSTKYIGANSKKIDEKMSRELRLFSFGDIIAATTNFSSTNKLGQGGFGPVYKGKLLDGQEVAIKRLSRSSGQGLVEFKNEILLIAKLQHTNLVRLLGSCIQGEEKVLVYEYMPNKSLDFFLFESSKRELLKWPKRFNIIEGIAQGLLYLHKYSRLRVIHRDLKASNILLDDNLNPKISDFGMAKIFGFNESEANTNRVVGTYGYMSPEYAIKGIVSIKTDVFSFGVLLLEIVSSKKNNSCYHLEHPLNLIGLAWKMWKEGRALELMDPTLADSCPPSEVMRCIHIGLLCVQDHAIDRPSMSDVIFMLKSETAQLPAPKQPAFFIEMDATDVVIENKLANCSVNELTLSEVEAR